MQTLLSLNDALPAEARESSGLTDPSAVMEESFRALVEREAARKPARIGGTMPWLKGVPRRNQTRKETEYKS